MRIAYRSLSLAVAMVILAACSASPAAAPAPSSTPAPTVEPSATPTAVPLVLPTPSAIVPLEDRLVAAIQVPFPDEMVFVQGFVWVKTDSGYLVQIDPATNTVVGETKLDTTTEKHDYCQGLGSDGTSIWACSTRGDENLKTIDVVRVDPATGSVVATVEVNKVHDQFDMPFFDNRIWVLADGGSKLVGIDTTTNEPGAPIDLGTRCFGVDAATDSLIVTCKLDDLILRVDPDSGEVVQRRTISSPLGVRAAADGLWVPVWKEVVRLDPDSLEPVVAFRLIGDVDLFPTPEAIWARLDDGFLYRIDPIDNQIEEQIVSDQRFYNMGDFLVTADSIWTSAGDDDLVLRISLP